MYKLGDKNRFNEVTSVVRLSDSACIPFDPANTDYQEYLRFLAEGGQPLPADNDGQTAE
jgi:hypothetical protein